MAFGKKYEYNPIPDHLGMLLVSAPGMGKTSFASKLVKDNKLGIVIDADGRFNDVVTRDSNFAPLSNEPSDMIDPKKVYDITLQSMPDNNVGLFLVDSLTAIIEPIILRVQRRVEEGIEKSARGYKEKADAMKYLQAALCPWGKDVIWVYHYRDRGNVYGKMETTTSVPETELVRIWRNINIKCEIVVDKNGKRGVKIIEARGGRTGFTIWDESGTWENIRERLEQEVWGGLTEEEQAKLLDDREITFSSALHARSWALKYSQDHGGFFKDSIHVDNTYDKLKTTLLEELGSELTADIMFDAWKKEVFRREEELAKVDEKEESNE